MEEDNSHIRRWHGRRPFSIDDEAVVDFLGITNGMKVLDVGGADGYYSKMFKSRGATVTIIDAHDYNFRELSRMGIETIQLDFCRLDEGSYDLVFMAHVYHDLVRSCKARTLENLSRISGQFIGNLDFTKEDFGFGPPTSEKLEKKQVVGDMKEIGFKLKKDRDIPYHYLQLFGRE
ncbi:MAG: class I SAM-dependent methyltransferase [Candidatus Thermoplasmatota archaeon]|nr:class I SAM-dependent methyltransferase [Candidatus Thermoplasmatota archaeon]